jgi:hypothetical protein
MQVQGEEIVSLQRENQSLRLALKTLVDIYVVNPGTKYQFICCITPNGSMPEWDKAMELLGMPMHSNRRISKR